MYRSYWYFVLVSLFFSPYFVSSNLRILDRATNRKVPNLYYDHFLLKILQNSLNKESYESFSAQAAKTKNDPPNIHSVESKHQNNPDSSILVSKIESDNDSSNIEVFDSPSHSEGDGYDDPNDQFSNESAADYLGNEDVENNTGLDPESDSNLTPNDDGIFPHELKKIKSLWKDSLSYPVSREAINGFFNQTNHESSKLRSNFQSKAQEDFFYQILFQFMNPLEIHPLKTNGSKISKPWLDQDFILQLKGTAFLALNSQLVRNKGSKIMPKISRFLSLNTKQTLPQSLAKPEYSSGGESSNSQTGFTYSGLSYIQESIVRSLAHSMGANVAFLNGYLLDRIRSRCLQDKSIRPGVVNKKTLLFSLFDLLNNDIKTSTVIYFNGNMDWLLTDEDLSHLALRQLKKNPKILFVRTSPDMIIEVPVQTPPRDSDGDPSMDESNFMPGFDMRGFFPAPGPNFQMPPQFVPFPPPPPPATSHFVRSFQVSFRNGTVTIKSIAPPNHLTRGAAKSHSEQAPPLSHGMMPYLQIPEEELMKMPKNGQNRLNISSFNVFGLPMFPPDMSDEDIQELLQDPDNQAKIKAAMEGLLKAINQDGLPNVLGLSPEELSALNPNFQIFGPFPMNSPNMGNGFPFHLAMNGVPPKAHPQSFKGMRPPRYFMPKQSPNRYFQSRSPSGTDPTRPSAIDPKSNPANSISPSGRALLSNVENFNFEPPKDHGMKQIWDSIVLQEAQKLISRANKKQILFAMEKNHLEVSASNGLDQLDEILSHRILRAEEINKALLIAIKLEAGRVSATKESGGEGELKLSQWALDMAFSSELGIALPRVGKIKYRSKDEISNMALDKYEKALAGNIISPEEIGVSYDQIGGLSEVKDLLRQSITYPLKYPRLYAEGMAAEAVKGVLLFGPPGTGKTMLAKAVATEGGATFLSVDASTIENKWLGESEKNARAVFTLARKLAPCVIYLDEVDSILSSRENGDESSHGTLTSVKTTLMQEWDGLRTTKDRVVVIASTNRPFDLDEAVLRRLPRRIMVDLPDLKTRTDILRVTLANNRLSPEVNLTQLAQKLEGYSGSDINEVCREAVVRVAHERAHQLEEGSAVSSSVSSDPSLVETSLTQDQTLDLYAPLREVTWEDFKAALTKLKASVDDTGRETQKVLEWNEKYGEIKKKNSRKQSISNLSMYI